MFPNFTSEAVDKYLVTGCRIGARIAQRIGEKYKNDQLVLISNVERFEAIELLIRKGETTQALLLCARGCRDNDMALTFDPISHHVN